MTVAHQGVGSHQQAPLGELPQFRQGHMALLCRLHAPERFLTGDDVFVVTWIETWIVHQDPGVGLWEYLGYAAALHSNVCTATDSGRLRRMYE